MALTEEQKVLWEMLKTNIEQGFALSRYTKDLSMYEISALNCLEKIIAEREKGAVEIAVNHGKQEMIHELLDFTKEDSMTRGLLLRDGVLGVREDATVTGAVVMELMLVRRFLFHKLELLLRQLQVGGEHE